MSDKTRLSGTLIIWLAFTITISNTFTSVTGPISRANGATLIVMAGILGLMATVSTLAVWLGGRPAADTSSDSRSKSKRRDDTRNNRIERLIEALDDDEVYDLEALLLARDRSSLPENGAARRRQDA